MSGSIQANKIKVHGAFQQIQATLVIRRSIVACALGEGLVTEALGGMETQCLVCRNVGNCELQQGWIMG